MAAFNRDCELEEEIEILKEIYINELQLSRDNSGRLETVSIQLHPATGDQEDQKYVCLILVFTPPDNYPFQPPSIAIRNPRGLGEEYIKRLENDLKELADERCGECMLFELIDLAKDSLTQGNIPHGECVICMNGFTEEDSFTRTSCYHYFHCHCLLRHVRHSEEEIEDEYRQALQRAPHINNVRKEVVCPVCRSSITGDYESLKDTDVSMTTPDSGSVCLSPQIRSLQDNMRALFRFQQQKGGIINLEAERNKYLVLCIPTETNPDELSSPGVESPSTPSIMSAFEYISLTAPHLSPQYPSLSADGTPVKPPSVFEEDLSSEKHEVIDSFQDSSKQATFVSGRPQSQKKNDSRMLQNKPTSSFHQDTQDRGQSSRSRGPRQNRRNRNTNQRGKNMQEQDEDWTEELSKEKSTSSEKSLRQLTETQKKDVSVNASKNQYQTRRKYHDGYHRRDRAYYDLAEAKAKVTLDGEYPMKGQRLPQSQKAWYTPDRSHRQGAAKFDQQHSNESGTQRENNSGTQPLDEPSGKIEKSLGASDSAHKRSPRNPAEDSAEVDSFSKTPYSSQNPQRNRWRKQRPSPRLPEDSITEPYHSSNNIQASESIIVESSQMAGASNGNRTGKQSWRYHKQYSRDTKPPPRRNHQEDLQNSNIETNRTTNRPFYSETKATDHSQTDGREQSAKDAQRPISRDQRHPPRAFYSSYSAPRRPRPDGHHSRDEHHYSSRNPGKGSEDVYQRESGHGKRYSRQSGSYRGRRNNDKVEMQESSDKASSNKMVDS